MWVLSWLSAMVLWADAPVWAHNMARAGLAAFVGLVVWWAISGFSGYEHTAGFRIIRRESPRQVLSWKWGGLALLAAAGGLVALELGYRSPIAVAEVALMASLVLILVAGRFFSVFATLSIVGVAIGVAALIVVQSVATGFQHEFERRVLGVYAHINVTRTFGVSEYRRFESYLRGVPGVEGASPFVYYGMTLAPYDPNRARPGDLRQASVLVKGVEPTTAPSVMDLREHLDRVTPGVEFDSLDSDLVLHPVRDREDDHLPGAIVPIPDPRGENWYDEAMAAWKSTPKGHRSGPRRRVPIIQGDDDWPDEAETTAATAEGELPTMFVGVTLARELGLTVGDRVRLVDPGATFDHSEAPAFRDYQIAGVFQAGFQEYDSRLVYVHIKELQHFKYRGRDVVSGVDLRLTDPYLAPQVAKVLAASVGEDEYSILEWQKLNANLFQSIQTQKSILTIILSLVSTVAGFNVLAALWTMVVRRNAEIAIMMSMGATAPSVARVFQFAGMTIGIVGSIAGLGLGLVLCRLVELYGYTLDPEAYFVDHLPVEYDFTQTGAVLAMTLAISFVATIPPALRAARLRPVEGLRYE